MNFPNPQIPDLLRRFVPTPHQRHLRFQDTRLVLQTNDVEILSELQRASDKCDMETSPSGLLMRIIRDGDAPEEHSQVVILSCGPVATVLAGTGTVLLVDSERDEILGFVAPSISALHFVDELLPLLLELRRHGRPH